MPTDEELVERSRAGDRSAFEELFIRYRDVVFNVAWSISGDREQAEDITQEAFVRAYRGLVGFRGESRFSTWLYRIVVNQAIRTKGVAGRRQRQETRIEDATMASGDLQPDGAAERSDLERRVRGALSELSPEHRAAVTLRYLERLDLQEIAEIVGCPVGTVKSRLFHALKNMSFLLRDLRDV